MPSTLFSLAALSLWVKRMEVTDVKLCFSQEFDNSDAAKYGSLVNKMFWNYLMRKEVF